MAAIETLLLAGLIAWGAASFCYALRVPGLHPWLRRWNVFSAYVQWSMFNAPVDPPGAASHLAIEYRDTTDHGGSGEWMVVPGEFSCGWRGFFWMPERRLVLRVREVLAEATAAAGHGPAAADMLQRRMVMLQEYLRVVRPLPPGTQRQIRVVERREPGARGPGERLVAEHTHGD